jgi:hypothetical protein
MRRIVAVSRFAGRPGCRVTIGVIGSSGHDFSLHCPRRFAAREDKGHALTSPMWRWFRTLKPLGIPNYPEHQRRKGTP